MFSKILKETCLFDPTPPSRLPVCDKSNIQRSDSGSLFLASSVKLVEPCQNQRPS